MIVLHACQLERDFLIWGENPVPDHRPSAQRKGKVGRRPYPYGAKASESAAAIRAGFPDLKTPRRGKETIEAWLPTRGAQPIASSPLIAEPPASRAKTVLAPWITETLSLSGEAAIELLSACVSRQTLAPGVVIGADLAFWTKALRLAASIVTRQRYLPTLQEVDGAYEARWKPILDAKESDRVRRLAQYMPPVARALSNAGSPGPPEMASVALLKQFLDATVDTLVRIGASGTIRPALAKARGRAARSKPGSLHERWLHALRSAGAEMEGSAAELQELARQVREWQRPLQLAAFSPFRLFFRLEEPSAEQGEPQRFSPDLSDDSWSVRYLLQSAHDPSLLIPVEDAWKGRGRGAAALKRSGFKAREHLLASLGQAAGVCPRIEASLSAAAPAGYHLDTAGAHQFLAETSMALEQAGFGVMLPAWWTRKGTKQRFTARANVKKSPKMTGGGGISLDDVVDFEWEIALGDQKLTLKELKALARLKSPLVRVRGQWVEMSAEEIRAAVSFWKEKKADSATMREILFMALGAAEPAGGIAFEGVKAGGWIGKTLRQLDRTSAFEEKTPPERFCGTLRPYQVRGYSWLAFLREMGLGACLADDMGLGKTIQALALVQRDWEAGMRRPALLVCPTSVLTNWQREAQRFVPSLPVMVHHGIRRKKGAALRKAAQSQALVITSYALLHRDLDHLTGIRWAGAILDEAQNIKNPETKQARAARSFEAPYRIALTGTPVENHVGELWSIMEFLNPGLLGKQSVFKKRFFIPIQAGRDMEVAERLRRITGPFILRRLKTDKSIIDDLPEKQEMKVFCTLTKEQASLYAAVVEEAQGSLATAEGIGRRGMILATISKLKQVCNHPAQFLGDNSAVGERSGKLARLAEMLEEIVEAGDRALVFTQFTEMGAIIHRHLLETTGREALFLHGGVSRKRRDDMIERFQEAKGGPPVFILSLKAGGTGLNLTAASHVFHFDRWWNPAVENQATDRAFRIGQTRNVQVHKFLCAGTLEEKIDEMIERKKEVAESIVGAGEAWLTELSNEKLKDLFALSKEAVRA